MSAVPCLLVAFAATIDHRAIRGMLGLGVVVQLVYWLPHGWTQTDAIAAGWLGLVGLAAGAVAAGAYGVHRYLSGPPSALANSVAIVILATGAASLLKNVRSAYRHDLYRQMALGRSYTNFPVAGSSARSATSSPIWRRLDRPDEPVTVAATFGWDGRGVHWFVYPLYGRRLQNDVRHVPVTTHGEVIAHRREDTRQRQADYEA